jgi:hypothetical protein
LLALSGVIAVLTANGCDKRTTGGISGSGASCGTAPSCDGGGPCIPPSPAGNGTPAGTQAQNFAIRYLHLGDEPGCCQDGTSWCLYGYDLDGQNTQVSGSTMQHPSCLPVANANPLNEQDGPGGLDNSFGPNVVNILLEAFVANPSQALGTTIGAGDSTMMIDVAGLAPNAGQDTTAGLSGMIFAGVSYAQSPNSSTAVPTFTTADNWPVDPRYVPGAIAGHGLPMPLASAITFLGAYDSRGTFVSGSPIAFTLTLSFPGPDGGLGQLVLPIQHATITFTHLGAQDGGATSRTHLAGGIIAGIIDAQQLVDSATAVAGAFNICSGSTLTTTQQLILKAADIMDDASYQPTATCNGISIGLGFEAEEIGPPQFAGTPTSYANLCEPDAGADDGGAITDSGADSPD